MTIYQISTESKANLFDFALQDKFKSREEYNQCYKKQLGEGLDVKIVNQKIEYYNTFNYLIIDREAFANEDRYCVQMMKTLLSFMQNTIPIFIWVNMPDNYKHELIETGVKNLIISDTLDEQKEEILECLSEKGMQRYNTNWKTSGNENFEKYKFKEQNGYSIQLLTTSSETKSISISMSLSLYINKVGGKVCYIAPMYSDNKIEAIARLVEAEKQDSYYIKENIYITNDEDFNFAEKGVDFLIRDLGFINDTMFIDYLKEIDNDNFDKNIIICDPNTLEIDTIKMMLEKLNNNTYIVNSTNKYIDINSLSNLSSIEYDFFSLIDKQRRIKRLEKQDELIDIRTNRNFFNMLIEPHIVATSVDT